MRPPAWCSPPTCSSTSAAYSRIGDALHAAYTTHETVEPPRTTVPGLDLASAYRIQQHQENLFLEQGHRIIGRKIGLTSLAMQQQLGVDSLDFGFVTDRMLFTESDGVPADRHRSADHGKAIIILNPVEPPTLMRNTVYCALSPEAAVPGKVRDEIAESLAQMVETVQSYVAG